MIHPREIKTQKKMDQENLCKEWWTCILFMRESMLRWYIDNEDDPIEVIEKKWALGDLDWI